MTTRQQLDDLCQRHTEIPVVIETGAQPPLDANGCLVPLGLSLHTESVHEPLFLEAVTLQGRVNNSAPDTDGWGDGVLSRDKQINVAFADGKGVPPFKVQKIGQDNKVTKSDFTVPVLQGLYGY